LKHLQSFRRLFFISICFFYLPVIAWAESVSLTEEGTSAKAVVESFQGVLLDVMKQGEQLGFNGRYELLSPAVVTTHDLNKIARIVVGREWEKLTDSQQEQLTDSFSRLSISAYAHNFKDFSGESFQFESIDETSRGGIIVHSIFVLPDNKNVKFDYMLKKMGENWKIINIIANGVSDLALKRSEYTSVLQREGFEALIAKINEKINNYANQ
jgi:phospholipid transport system substrate-binding protein